MVKKGLSPFIPSFQREFTNSLSSNKYLKNYHSLTGKSNYSQIINSDLLTNMKVNVKVNVMEERV